MTRHRAVKPLRCILSALLAPLVPFTSGAQTTDSCSPRMFRFEEDCRSRAAHAAGVTGTDALRYIPLAADDDIWLTLGAEYRYKAESLDSPDFGIGKGDTHYTAQGHRLYVDLDLRARGGERIFVQFAAAAESGRKPAERTFDRSHPDLQQGFLEFPLPIPDTPTFLRVGRQEFDFGGNRLISTRDPAGLQRSFDMARLETTSLGVDLVTLYGRQVINRVGWLDDTSNSSDSIYGAIATLHPKFDGRPLDLQLYYLEHERALAIYQSARGAARYQAAGARLELATGNWRIAAQATYEFGRLASYRVTGASGVSVEAGYSLETLAFAPHLDLVLGRTSGNRGSGNSHSSDYDPLYPNLDYYTDAPELYPVNLTDINPSVTLNFTHSMNLRFGSDVVFRTSRHDGVYAASGIPFIVGNGNGSSYVATLPYSHLTWLALPHVQLDLGAVYGFIGELVARSPGARRLTYGQLKATYKF